MSEEHDTSHDGSSSYIHNVEEMRQNIVVFGQINGEIKSTQDHLKGLKDQKGRLSSSIKNFMRFNQLTTCHISPSVATDIRKIKYVERESKQRITLKMVELYFEEFFNHIDVGKFMALSNNDKSKAFFNFLETKRETTVLDSIIIR
uniref:Uncharacterized protein n=1 Tax=viral metagenome TaxID=1070528 RepID=A0A6C0CQ63_9ZZZZ